MAYARKRARRGAGNSMLSGAFAAASAAAKIRRKSFTVPRFGIKSKSKRSNSRTMTRTKGGLHCKVKQDGTGTSRSLDYIRHPSPKGLGRIIKGMKSLQQFDLTGTLTVDTGSSGVQAVASIAYLFHANAIQTMYNTASIPKSVVNTAIVPTYQGQQKSFKIWLQEVNQYTTFSNTTNANATLDIYDCVARHDRTSQIAPDTDWNNGVLYDQAGASLSSSGLGSTTPFQTPFYSNLFNRFWKVKKITHVELAQGRSHEHILKFKPNRILDTERVASSNVIAGLTMVSMIVVRGLPAIVTGSGTGMPAFGGTSTLSRAVFATVNRIQYKYRFVDTMPSLYSGPAPVYSTASTTVLSEGAGAPAILTEAD